MKTLREIWEYDRTTIDGTPTLREWNDRWRFEGEMNWIENVDGSETVNITCGNGNSLHNFIHSTIPKFILKDKYTDEYDRANSIIYLKHLLHMEPCLRDFEVYQIKGIKRYTKIDNSTLHNF